MDTKDIERSIIKTYRNEIWRRFTKAINEYELICDGDRIAVCISGGKDSNLMAKLFQELARHGKHNFEVTFLCMDPGYSEANRTRIEENAQILGIPLTIFETDIFASAEAVSDNACYLCARMRRGHLYAKAKELGCNKIALGHHFDDVIETLLMSMLYGGQLQGMRPKLKSTNFEGMELIRPMYLIREADIIRWKNYCGLEFLNCACRFTEKTSDPNTDLESKRRRTKELIAMLAKEDPVIEKNIFRSAYNVNVDTLITYKKDGVKHNFLEEY